MDRASWRRRSHGSMVAFWRLLAAGSAGGRLLEGDGWVAAVVPATPERSVFNSVLYSDRASLAGSIREIADAYERAGVRAWTVWVPEDDVRTAELLAQAGHSLDATPREMGIELDGAAEPDLREVDWGCGGRVEDLAAINDAAYGYPSGTFARGLGDLAGEVLLYQARLGGRPVAGMMALDAGDDTNIGFVATLPDAQGRGLAGALMRRAIWDASRRGQRTASLQATRAGYPIYRHLGFADLGALQMWERRSGRGLRPAAAE